MDALGQSDIFLAFQELLSEVAVVDRSTLLIGERGTGKELASRRLHYLSHRWERPFVALNCAALPSSLIESELFGHEAGAYTGATSGRPGRFEAADGGTLFLDEIGQTSIAVQEKILRAVEYGAFERLGSSEPIQVDVRIVGATNVDLRERVKEGVFKADLLDRLSFVVLNVPPLRDRQGDVALLANHFAGAMASELGIDGVIQFTEEALGVLQKYDWPGNIRELKNVVERAVFHAGGSPIHSRDIVLDPFQKTVLPPGSVSGISARADEVRQCDDVSEYVPVDAMFSTKFYELPFKEAVHQAEIARLARGLADAHYNQKRAAQLLGLTYDQFRGVYRKHSSVLNSL